MCITGGSQGVNKRSVGYFRNLLCSETQRLQECCRQWEEVSSANPNLDDEGKHSHHDNKHVPTCANIYANINMCYSLPIPLPE